MEKPLLSLILPIYNVEKYLNYCVDSILNQIENENIEILLIDDGSTDSSSSICDSYKDKRIKVYHKKNGGLSDARNYGLLKSNSDYVFFIDSDDFIEKECIKDIISSLKRNKDLEVILFDAKFVDESGKEINKSGYSFNHKGLENNKIYTGREIIENQLNACDEYLTTVWLGVYKKSLLIDNSFFFEKGLIHEDEMWTPKVLIEANKVLYINKKYYCYRIREDSIMRDNKKNNFKHIEAQIYIFSSLYKYYTYKIKDESFLKNINDNLSKRYLHAITKYEFHKYPKLYKRVNKLEILKESSNPKNILRAFLLFINKYLYSYFTVFLKNKKG